MAWGGRENKDDRIILARLRQDFPLASRSGKNEGEYSKN